MFHPKTEEDNSSHRAAISARSSGEPAFSDLSMDRAERRGGFLRINTRTAATAEYHLCRIHLRVNLVGDEARAFSHHARYVNDPATLATDEMMMPATGNLIEGSPRPCVGDRCYPADNEGTENIVDRGTRERRLMRSQFGADIVR